MTLEAADEQQARRRAGRQGLLVASARPAEGDGDVFALAEEEAGREAVVASATLPYRALRARPAGSRPPSSRTVRVFSAVCLALAVVSLILAIVSVIGAMATNTRVYADDLNRAVQQAQFTGFLYLAGVQFTAFAMLGLLGSVGLLLRDHVERHWG